ncbi:hypothetical protein KKH39_01430 [Patescibacteria group bacterium]|nr:hypothetical protein [Patescibacteria group bacterium]
MKKIITLSVLSIGVIFIAGCTTQQTATTNENANQITTEINKNTNQAETSAVAKQPAPATDETLSWQIYQGDYGFEIKYPQNWEIVNEVNAKDLNRPSAVLLNVSFGDGTRGNGYDGELFISVYDKKTADTETPIKNVGTQFSDRQEKRENITVNGVSAVKVTITTPSTPSWIYEVIVLENGNYSYLINNGAIKSDLFDKFYNSFKLN